MSLKLEKKNLNCSFLHRQGSFGRILDFSNTWSIQKNLAAEFSYFIPLTVHCISQLICVTDIGSWRPLSQLRIQKTRYTSCSKTLSFATVNISFPRRWNPTFAPYYKSLMHKVYLAHWKFWLSNQPKKKNWNQIHIEKQKDKFKWLKIFRWNALKMIRGTEHHIYEKRLRELVLSRLERRHF